MPERKTHSIEKDHLLEAVYQLAETTEYDAAHSQQVTRIALDIFNQLMPLHQLSKADRDYLQYASILHDIGWIEGWKGHHKTTLQIILNTKLLPLSSKDRLIIGSIARYHRGNLPSNDHDHYKALTKHEKEKVRILSSILRVADGMDHSHRNNLKNIFINITPKKIIMKCITQNDVLEDQETTQEKSDLFEQLFSDRSLVILWKTETDSQ